MEYCTRALEFLGKNYNPFTHFSKDMLAQVKSDLRIFEAHTGESLILQACSTEDYIYVTEGKENISHSGGDQSFSIDATEKRHLSFSMQQ